MTEYFATPLVATPDGRRAEIISEILERTAESDNLFMDRAETKEERKQRIASILTRPDTLPMEVWKTGEEDGVALTGILYLTRIVAGADAVAHYIFFDRSLGADKTEMMKAVLDWVFEDHENWEALRRITAEVPDYAFTLARHASKKLGFGGPYEYEMDDKAVAIEGVKRNAAVWNGDERDILILGLTREEYTEDED